MEIERKFLVNSLPPNWKRGSGSEILQGYFSLSSRDVEIRLRRKDSQHFLTVKSGRGRVRLEEEISISEKRFENLWPLVKNACVLKRRFKVPFGERTIELDVYRARHSGLITADVEFPTKRQSELFKPPAWFGREITGNRRYANESLARRDHV